MDSDQYDLIPAEAARDDRPRTVGGADPHLDAAPLRRCDKCSPSRNAPSLGTIERPLPSGAPSVSIFSRPFLSAS